MKLKLLAAIAVIVAVPFCVQAQPKPAAAKPTKADAQKVVQVISADKAKAKIYCDISKLGEQMDEADQKKDTKKLEALAKQADEMAAKLGPEYAKLMEGMQALPQDSKDAQEIGTILEALDKPCAK